MTGETHVTHIRTSGSLTASPRRRDSLIGGLPPFIGVILFIISTVSQFAGGAGESWGPDPLIALLASDGLWASDSISELYIPNHLRPEIVDRSIRGCND